MEEKNTNLTVDTWIIIITSDIILILCIPLLYDEKGSSELFSETYNSTLVMRKASDKSNLRNIL